MRGRIKTWLGERGFGFITPDDGGDDVFFHMSQAIDAGDFQRDDEVEFEIATSQRTGRTEAQKVRLSQ